MIRSKLGKAIAALSAVGALALGTGTPTTAAAQSLTKQQTTADAVSAAARADDVRQAADHIMSLRYYDFTNHPKVPPFDWSNDGCSGPQEIKDLFTEACNQHDFGYRNYGSQSGGLRLSPIQETKDWIDTRFWHEMRQTCFDHHGGGNWCLLHARAAYEAVHRFGDEYFWAAG